MQRREDATKDRRSDNDAHADDRRAGNAPEVIECLDILRTGEGESRLLELCRALGGGMLMLGGYYFQAEGLELHTRCDSPFGAGIAGSSGSI